MSALPRRGQNLRQGFRLLRRRLTRQALHMISNLPEIIVDVDELISSIGLPQTLATDNTFVFRATFRVPNYALHHLRSLVFKNYFHVRGRGKLRKRFRDNDSSQPPESGFVISAITPCHHIVAADGNYREDGEGDLGRKLNQRVFNPQQIILIIPSLSPVRKNVS